ncbi:protein FAM47E-like [Lissotriton helveticus]
MQEQGQYKQQPWYKERVTTKYLKDPHTKRNLSGSLNGCRWRFLDPAVDDFRDGYPPQSSCLSPLQTKGATPIIHNLHEPPGARDQKKPRRRFTKDQIVFSKLLPLQQARREYIDEIEYGLTKHPLALYPHLEDGIPPELFEDVIDILDPDMRLDDETESCITPVEEQVDECKTPEKEQQGRRSLKTKDLSTRQSPINGKSKTKNPYKWISTHDGVVKEDLTCKKMQSTTPRIPENVKEATKEFCDWIKSLGGDTYNIDESTIFSLFASGFDTTPALSVPIHVVELNNVPAELRKSVGATKPRSGLKASKGKDQELKRKESTYQPSWVKIKYGAWYIKPNLWRKLQANETLNDPHDGEDTMSPKTRIRLHQQDLELIELHGTTAFKEFIESKGYRNPEFLAKILAKKEASNSDGRSSRASANSSKRSSWYRSQSASTHEESLIN